VLIVSPPTAHALAPHASGRSFVMFVQAPINVGPILIEPVLGANIGRRLGELARDNAYEAMLIGLIETATPDEHAQQIAAQSEPLHHRWYAPTGHLLVIIRDVGQTALQQLFGEVHPGALSEELVDIKEMASILSVSEPTVRRMVARGDIPCIRGSDRVLRFVPRDVIASMQRQ
jgi:excisionase family DNA binding protein